MTSPYLNTPIADIQGHFPVYVFYFTAGNSQYAFQLSNTVSIPGSYALGASNLATTDISSLISSIVTCLETNGWDGNTVSDISVTLYKESGIDVTP